jgi:transposase-like protein
MAKWTRHSLDFKRRVVQRMQRCDDVAALARELNLHRSVLYRWRAQLEGRPGKNRADLSAGRRTRAEQKLEQENRLLKEALGQKTLEADFFAAALRRIEELRQNSGNSGEMVSTPRSKRGADGRKAS